MSDELTALTAVEAAARIREKAISPVELTRAYLERIERLEERLNSYLTVCHREAMTAAREAERAVMAGEALGPLHGVPIAMKDLYDTAGVRTTAGSRLWAERVPEEDSTAWARLKAAGALLLGKTGTHEWAYGTTGVNPHFGPVRNPWDTERITGGSSSGSGTAVVADLCAAAMGSDTGGSIRMPAALCGLVGIKPTYGRASRFGIAPLSWSLDHPGPMTKSVADAALLLGALAGPDARDPVTCNVPEPEDYLAALTGNEGSGSRPLRGIRVALLPSFMEGCDPEIAAAVEAAFGVLTGLGAEAVAADLPGPAETRAPFAVIISSEATAVHDARLRAHAAEYGADVRERLQSGYAFSAVEYLTAQRVRRHLVQQYEEIFARVDVLVTPTVPVTTPRIGETTLRIGDRVVDTAPLAAGAGNPPASYSLAIISRNTHPFNFSGQPVLSLPCGFTRAGLPIGLQISGSAWDEATVLRVAHAYERATEWHLRRPNL
jgi:aspartyl-tRNA(Asn)/glutamyl-tRNA(Gln) amidotransferase subunit A